MTKRIVLCADDYGQASSVSAGILDLIKNGRLTATSCLVNFAHWPDESIQLKPFCGQIDIGLHFNLTEGKALSATFRETYGDDFFSLPALLQRSILRKLDQNVLAAECEAQLLRFKDAMGVWPDFLDGHQHVHQFPIIQNAVLSVYEKYLRTKGTYIRLAQSAIAANFDVMTNLKKFIINKSGAKSFKKNLLERKIPFNHSFAGIYNFAKNKNFPLYFRSFLQEIGDYGLIMCHPGKGEKGAYDPIAEARAVEYQYLNSEQFLRDCTSYKIVLTRYP